MIVDEYQETQVLTASPQQLHLMVVDGALQYARRAFEALEARDREAAFVALGRSREFVGELIGGLRPDGDSEMCSNLKQLFAFVFHRLVAADMQQDPALVVEAIRILEKHRETWLELMDVVQKGTSASSSAVPGSDRAFPDGSTGLSWSV